jgi:fibronectin-binding autotransporter adhesin
VAHYDPVTITATVTPGSSPISTVVAAAGWIPGGSVALVAAGGNVYTNTIIMGASAAGLGPNDALVTATDTSYLNASATVSVTVVAANRIWNGLGGDDNWSTSPNWAGGKIAGIGDSATFTGNARLTPSMDSNQSLTGIVFDGTAGAFTVGTAGSTLTLAGSGIANNSSALQTLSIPIVLPESQTFNMAAGDLELGGKLSGAGGLVKAGEGLLTVKAVNEYTGPTTINAGMLLIADGAKLYYNGGGPVTINAGTVLSMPGGVDISWGGCLHFLEPTANRMIINGGTLQHRGRSNRQADAGAGRGFTIGTLGATLESVDPGEVFSIGFWNGITIESPAGGSLTLTGEGDGVLDFAVPGSGGLTKDGAGNWTLTKMNSYTGDTRVLAGTLTFNTNGIAAASTVVIKSNAVLNLNFTGANTVQGLVIGVTPMPPGTYDANKAPEHISGTGSLVVTGSPNPDITIARGQNSITISWPEDYAGWNLQAQTNSLGTTWYTIPGSSAVTTLTQPIDPANTSVFYRLSH